MNEFIEKLICRLLDMFAESEYCVHKMCESKTDEECNTITCEQCYVAEIKKRINELAEEYNGGWIPCSERLPEVSGNYLVTYKKYENLLVGYWLFNGIDFNQTEEVEVLYWQPLPEPYKPKGE